MSDVIDFRPRDFDPAHELSLRRQALQIAALLPEDKADAIAILKYAEELVSDFLGPDTEVAR
jgi:hypothetical protein